MIVRKKEQEEIAAILLDIGMDRQLIELMTTVNVDHNLKDKSRK